MVDSGTRPLWQRMLWRRVRGLGMLVGGLLLIVLGIYLLAPQWIVRAVEWSRANSAHLERHEVIAGATRWAYYEGGSGPTIVLLHGFTGSKDNWVEVAGELARNFHVLIPDLPGWGDSQYIADADYAPPAQVRRLAAFVDRLDMKNIILVGHSMGGVIAGMYAASHPDRVAAVGFVDSGGVGHLQPALVGDKDPFAYTDRAGLQQLLALVFTDPPQLPGRIEHVFVNRNRSRLDMIKRTFRQLSGPTQRDALAPLLPKLDKPVLVMWCHDDKLISADALDVFRKNLTASPRIDVTTLFGCSHMPMMEKPHETAQAIVRFILPPRTP